MDKYSLTVYKRVNNRLVETDESRSVTIEGWRRLHDTGRIKLTKPYTLNQMAVFGDQITDFVIESEEWEMVLNSRRSVCGIVKVEAGK